MPKKEKKNFFPPFFFASSFFLSLFSPLLRRTTCNHDNHYDFIHFIASHTARDCLYLGKQSFNNGYYGQSIEWFEQAMLKASQEGNKTAPLEEIVPFYNMAVEIVSF